MNLHCRKFDIDFWLKAEAGCRAAFPQCTEFLVCLCRASAPAVMPAAPAGRQAKRGNAAASQGGSMEDVSLKSLAPQGSRGLDNAALRAHLTGSARRAAGTSGAASQIREDEQGAEHASDSPCLHACTVAS